MRFVRAVAVVVFAVSYFYLAAAGALIVLAALAPMGVLLFGAVSAYPAVAWIFDSAILTPAILIADAFALASLVFLLISTSGVRAH